MATEVAALGLKADSSGVVKATDDLREFTGVAKGADAAAEGFEASARGLGGQAGKAAADTSKLGAAAKTTAGAMDRAAANTNNVSGSMNRAATGSNRLGSAIAGASFQVQDFAVQVASGQSALIAFAQQFPQLAGVFGVAGPLALVGAALGTLVAVGAAVIPMLFDMGRAAKELENNVDDLGTSFNAYAIALDRTNQPARELSNQFGDNAEKAGKLYEAMAKLAELDFANRMTAVRDSIGDTVSVITDALENIDDTFARRNSALGQAEVGRKVEQLRREVGLTEEQARSAKTALDQLNSATTVLGQAEGAQRLADILVQARDESGRLPANFQQVATSLYQAAAYGLQFSEAVKNGSESEKEALRAAQDKIAAYNQQAMLAQAITQYGRESAQVEALKRQAAIDTVDAYIEQNNLSGDVAKELRDAAARAYDAEAATNAWAGAMAGVKSQLEAIAGVLSSLGAGAIERVSMAAQKAALDAGKSISEARKAGIRAQEDIRLNGQKAGLVGQFGNSVGGFLGGALEAELADRRKQQDALEARYSAAAEAERVSRKAASRRGSSGGSSRSERDPYADLIESSRQFIEQQKLEAQTLGMTEQAANRLRYEQDLLNQAANDNISLTAAQKTEIAGLANQMAATEENTKRLKDAFDFAKDATKGFITDLRTGLQNGESFFKSFVNAATNLLNKLISKIEDELVNALMGLGGASSGSGGLFSGILGGIGKLFGFAKGGAFDGGAQRFAKGSAFTNQIVNRPTPFRFARGAGLMGEAGPEAIMPLGRDANGRLGVYGAANQNGGGVQYVVVEVQGNLVEKDGQISATIDRRSQKQVQMAAPGIVNAAKQQAVPAMAEYQANVAGAEWR